MKLCDKHSEQQGAFTFAVTIFVKNNTIKSNIKLIEIYEDTQNRITLIKQRACRRSMGVNKKKIVINYQFSYFSIFYLFTAHSKCLSKQMRSGKWFLLIEPTH